MSLKLSGPTGTFGPAAGHDPAKSASTQALVQSFAMGRPAANADVMDHVASHSFTLAQGPRGEGDIRAILSLEDGKNYHTGSLQAQRTLTGDVRYSADMIGPDNQRLENGLIIEQTKKGLNFEAELPSREIFAGPVSDDDKLLGKIPVRNQAQEISPIEQFAQSMNKSVASNDLSI